MSPESDGTLAARAAAFAALGDPVRLRIVDRLHSGDAIPSHLAGALGVGSNLLAHHLNVLQRAGLIRRFRSEGDRRRTYVSLVRTQLPHVVGPPLSTPQRVLFVCTANTARSLLAALLWQAASDIPGASAGTHPAGAVDPGAAAVAARHGFRIPAGMRPQPLAAVRRSGDLIVTVCDRAQEELSDDSSLHWSVPDPVPAGTARAFESAVRDLDHRVHGLAERLSVA